MALWDDVAFEELMGPPNIPYELSNQEKEMIKDSMESLKLVTERLVLTLPHTGDCYELSHKFLSWIGVIVNDQCDNGYDINIAFAEMKGILPALRSEVRSSTNGLPDVDNALNHLTLMDKEIERVCDMLNED